MYLHLCSGETKSFFSVTCDKIRTAIAIISNLKYSLQLWEKATKTPKQQKQKKPKPQTKQGCIQN